MAANYFHEIFRYLWTRSDEGTLATSHNRIEAIHQEVLDIIRSVDPSRAERLEPQLSDDIDANIDQCQLQYIPKEFEKRARKEGLTSEAVE